MGNPEGPQQLPAHLTDPWFEARFVRFWREDASYEETNGLEGAQALFLWCPCGYGKPQYPLEGARPHVVMIAFRNPIGAPTCTDQQCSRGRDGRPTRWNVSGTSLEDLTLVPSIDVGRPSCWHGFITTGVVT